MTEEKHDAHVIERGQYLCDNDPCAWTERLIDLNRQFAEENERRMAETKDGKAK